MDQASPSQNLFGRVVFRALDKAISLTASILLPALLATALTGCESRQQKALDQARQQAAKTNQPQQVVSVDDKGVTTTTIVQPPAPGQTNETVTTTTTPPAPGAPVPPPAAPKVSPVPVSPPQPVNVTIPAGTSLSIRIDQRISVKTSHAGDTFSGEVVDPVLGSDGNVLVPKGTPVAGIVAVSHRRSRFRGRSLLELRLISMTLNGTQYQLTTHRLTESKKGKGKRSAAMIGGGAGLGMLVGGIATGGVGLVVGGLAGGGAGTAAAGLTGNRDLDIPAESVVHFTLADDLVVQEQAQ